ncbi:hypothetical protein [Mixta gaviniae]|uniref:Uncharacterized protein n=1 Tax=Mixta gaviniae TaxID=665914 RepID=A0A2L0IEW0_9GAMM|nr:hypothetical protein [Mixta gaviniae]AUX93125.1 hypothetical protein C2E15_08540 [Mixta gaviniae]
MRMLINNDIKLVTGAGANTATEYVGHMKNADKYAGGSGSGNKGGGFYTSQGVVDCNNGIIGGVIMGAYGLGWGMALGVVGGALAGGCFKTEGGNGAGGGSGSNGSNCNDGGCSW